jgi:hypothetical protein
MTRKEQIFLYSILTVLAALVLMLQFRVGELERTTVRADSYAVEAV